MRSAALLLASFAVLSTACRRDCPAPPATTAPPASPAPAAPALAASPDQLPPGVNAVQNEMRLLHEAMRDSVSAIALGKLSEIPERLHAVHRARALTEHALETGSYVLPKNADQLAAFKALDDAFHGELEKLVEAATANDPVATGTALGSVMSRCEGCHAMFRVTK